MSETQVRGTYFSSRLKSVRLQSMNFLFYRSIEHLVKMPVQICNAQGVYLNDTFLGNETRTV